jgi:hypothetical protein
MCFGNQQIGKNQLFSNDWMQNYEIKKGNKMYGKYRKNKKKERDVLKQLQTLSVIPISDRPKLSRFNVPKVNNLLHKQRAFSGF